MTERLYLRDNDIIYNLHKCTQGHWIPFTDYSQFLESSVKDVILCYSLTNERIELNISDYIFICSRILYNQISRIINKKLTGYIALKDNIYIYNLVHTWQISTW